MLTEDKGTAVEPASSPTARYPVRDRRGPPLRPEPAFELEVGEPHPTAETSPIAESRRAVPFVDFAAPELIPGPAELVTSLDAAVRDACLAELANLTFDFRRALSTLVRHLPQAVTPSAARVAFMIETGQPADVETHDQFFRIRRVREGSATAFLFAAFRVLRVLRGDLEETQTSVDAARISSMASAVLSTVAAALQMERAPDTFHWRRAPARPSEGTAAKRWIRGHQLFAALSQCLLFTFNMMEHADREGDADGLARCADLVADLLMASACSLELTGDFPPEVYEKTIRNAMETPFLPSGFSGLLSSDHRQLVLRMKMLRPTIERLQRDHPGHHRRIIDALATVYESHAVVCARFVGVDRTSLLMSNSIGRSAVEQIDRFKQMRMRSWTTGSRPQDTE